MMTSAKVASTVDARCYASFQSPAHSEEQNADELVTCARDDEALKDVVESAAEGRSDQVRLRYRTAIVSTAGRVGSRWETGQERQREPVTTRRGAGRQQFGQQLQRACTRRTSRPSVNLPPPVCDKLRRRQRRRQQLQPSTRARFPVQHPPVLSVPSRPARRGRPHVPRRLRQPTQFTDGKSKQLGSPSPGAANNLSNRSVNIGGHLVYCTALHPGARLRDVSVSQSRQTESVCLSVPQQLHLRTHPITEAHTLLS